MNLSCADHIDHHSKAVRSALWIAIIFMVIEIIGGLIANSLALISDALHMFTDVGAFLLSLITLRITKWPSTPKMSYGYHRAEVLGALGSAISLLVLSLVLIFAAIKRFFLPPEVNGPIVLFIAAAGLIANIFMLRVLHPVHKHSLNVKAAYLHVLGDLLGSVGVIVSGIIIWLTHWMPIDPIITMLFALQIIYQAGKLTKEAIFILMERTPEEIDALALQKDLESLRYVSEVHDLHIWTISSHNAALSAHIISTKPHETLNDAHKLLEEKYHITHTTIQVEDPASFDPKYCFDCDK